MSSRAFFAVGLACALAVEGADREDPRVTVTPRVAARRTAGPVAAIRVDVKQILVPVTVTDSFGTPVSGLPRETFRLFEDGVEQQLKSLTSQDAPVSLGVVFDASGSMEGRLDQSRTAVARFCKTAIPGDEFFLVEFNDAPRILCQFTSDTERIEKSLVAIKPRSWTALFDAVYLSMQQMKRAKNPRKALMILSDGRDNNSRYTESEMKALVREGDVCIYTIALVGGGLIKRHVRMLRQLSEETGGRLYEVNETSELPEAVSKISAAIRDQYLLGYTPSDPRNNGLYRKIEVRLNQTPDVPRLRASWRNGYYAPEGW